MEKNYPTNLLLKDYYQWLSTLFGSSSVNVSSKINELSINVSKKNIIPVFLFLKKHTNCQYKMLSDLTCVDYFSKKQRFSVIYQLLSLRYSSKVTIRVNVNTSLASITSIFSAANWYEREVFDIFGVFFTNHPDLRRILTDYGFEGYPLRKDFPLSGFTEVRFDYNKQRIICEPVEFSQEFRVFYYVFPKKIEINNFQNFKQL